MIESGAMDTNRCESCLGEGTVKYLDVDTDGEEGTYESTCPKCGGSGKKE